MIKNKLIWLRDTFLRWIFSDIIDAINKQQAVIDSIASLKTYVDNKSIEIDVSVEKQINTLQEKINNLELQIKNANQPKENTLSVTKKASK